MFAINEYKIHFGYRKVYIPTTYDDAFETRITICEITKPEKDMDNLEIVLGRGEAICNPTDNFCKRLGRKLALTRALRFATAKYGLTKEARAAIWKKYFEVSPKSLSC